MKSRTRFAITLVGAVLCALHNAAIAQSSPGDSQGGQAAAIEGTWIVTISSQGVTLFTALQSFTAGGVTLGTGTGDRLPPFGMPTAPISPLYGSWSWSRMDNNTYVATICFFIFDPAGNAQYLFKTNMTYHLKDNNTFVGSGLGFRCDPNGDPQTCVNMTPPVTITATRLIAQGS